MTVQNVSGVQIIGGGAPFRREGHGAIGDGLEEERADADRYAQGEEPLAQAVGRWPPALADGLGRWPLPTLALNRTSLACWSTASGGVARRKRTGRIRREAWHQRWLFGRRYAPPDREGSTRRGARLRLRLDGRGLRLGRDHAAGLYRRADEAHPPGHGHHAARRAHAGHVRHAVRDRRCAGRRRTA